MLSSIVLSAAAALLGGVGAQTLDFSTNLNYRSPSLHPRLTGLEINVQGVHDRVNKERRLRKRDNGPVYTGNLTFPYGVASGDPYNTSVILWTAAQKYDEEGLYGGDSYPPICVQYQVSKTEDFSKSSLVTAGNVQTT